MRIRLALPLLMAGVVAVAGARQSTFRARVDMVTVDVSVTRDNLPVSGLSAKDFTVLDNGVAQDVEAVTIDSQPLDVTLLLDASDSVAGRMFERLTSAVGDTARLLTERDRLRVIWFSHAVKALSGFAPGGRAPALTQVVPQGGTSLFDALVAAMIKTRPPDRRHVLIGLTDGQDTTSIFDAVAVREVALRSDAVVHLALASQGPPESGTTPSGALNEVAAATGGTTFSFKMAESVSDLFKARIDDFRSGYVLRYAAKNVAIGGWHELTVTVNKPGPYLIRARKGYGGGPGGRP